MTKGIENRKRMLLRACKRCSGDMLRESAEYVCMQCGRSAPLPKGERLESAWSASRLPIAPIETGVKKSAA